MRVFIATCLFFASFSAQAQRPAEDLFWVYCGTEAPSNYITWYSSANSIKRDYKSLRKICLERGQDPNLCLVCPNCRKSGCHKIIVY